MLTFWGNPNRFARPPQREQPGGTGYVPAHDRGADSTRSRPFAPAGADADGPPSIPGRGAETACVGAGGEEGEAVRPSAKWHPGRVLVGVSALALVGAACISGGGATNPSALPRQTATPGTGATSGTSGGGATSNPIEPITPKEPTSPVT